MTKQYVFSKVWKHFIVEKSSRGYEKRTSMYRTSDLRKCAVGLLIPDRLYKPIFEGLLVGSLLSESPSMAKLFFGVESLIVEVQKAHDFADTLNFHYDLECRLRRIACCFSLKVPAIRV